MLPQGLIERGFTLDDLKLLRLDRPNGLVPVVLATYSALLLVVWSLVARTSFRPQLTSLAIGLVVLDFGLFAVAFHANADPRLYEQTPPVVNFLRQDPGLFRTAVYVANNQLEEREAQERLAVSWGMVYGLQDINGFNSLQPRRYTDYLFGPQQTDVSYGNLHDDALLASDNPVLSALNVKYLVVARDQQLGGLGAAYRLVWEDSTVRVYQNDRAYPRAYFASAPRQAPVDEETLKIVTAPGFDGRRVALVEGAATLPPDTPLTDAETVAITAYAPDRLEVRATATVPRLLVLSEMDFPGWHATIDGQEAPIHRTNYLFRGVIVPPGEHTVGFVYRPASVRNGLAISALALVIIIGLLFLTSRVPELTPRPTPVTIRSSRPTGSRRAAKRASSRRKRSKARTRSR
ncbi:MAG: YfhO family protein [Chloroflexia bacterium]